MSTQPVPPAPSAFDVIALIETKGMFFVAPRVSKESPQAHSVYVEPTTNKSYPEGQIYWLETATIYQDREPRTEMSSNFVCLPDLLSTMRTIAPLDQWQVFRGEPRSTK